MPSRSSHPTAAIVSEKRRWVARPWATPASPPLSRSAWAVWAAAAIPTGPSRALER